MITVKIDEDELLNMMMSELSGWNKTDEEALLYEKMWEKEIRAGIYDNEELDISGWVDNDVINNTEIIYSDDDRFADLLEAYKDGESYVDGKLIESVDNEKSPTMFLIRF